MSATRTPGRPFQPGKSGNPGGRPREAALLSKAVRAKLPPEEWFERVWELACGADDERVRLLALQTLADRGWGKPTEIVEHRGELSDEEYAEELREIAREHLCALPVEERIQLLADPAPTDTIQ